MRRRHGTILLNVKGNQYEYFNCWAGTDRGIACQSFMQVYDNTVYGFDADSSVMEKAIERGAIHHAAGNGTIGIADVTYVCLYPQLTRRFHTRQCRVV